MSVLMGVDGRAVYCIHEQIPQFDTKLNMLLRRQKDARGLDCACQSETAVGL